MPFKSDRQRRAAFANKNRAAPKAKTSLAKANGRGGPRCITCDVAATPDPLFGYACPNCGNSGSDLDYPAGMTGEPDGDGHEHDFGPFERTHFTGNPVRRCKRVGCKVVSMDGDDE